MKFISRIYKTGERFETPQDCCDLPVSIIPFTLYDIQLNAWICSIAVVWEYKLTKEEIQSRINKRFGL